MYKKLILILLTLLAVTSLSAQFRVPEAGRYYYWLYSPDLTSRGMGLGGIQKPSGVVINPASQAYIQRFQAEFAYGLAPGFLAATLQGEQFLNVGDFFLPFKITGGTVIPTRFANFSIYASYMNMSNMGFVATSGNNDLGIGKIGSLYFGVSKDFDDRFALGASANFKLSYNPLLTRNGDATPDNIFAGGGGIDLGFIWRPEAYVSFSKTKQTNWAFQDMEIAVTIKDLGMPLINFPSIKTSLGPLPWAWFPMPFTPGIGYSVNIFNNGSTYWKFLFDMQTPFFQNITFAAGTELQIVKLIVLRASYTFDLEGILEYSRIIPQYGYMYNPANLAFGLSVQFSSNQFKKRSREEQDRDKYKENQFSIDIGARPYHNGFIFDAGCTITIGARDEKPPEITYIQRDTHVSPNLDGIQDEIVIDLDIKDERYVRFWKLEIYDSEGSTVRTIASKEQRVESMKPGDIVRQFFSPKTGILIPRQVIWDARDNSGDIVGDGEYTFKFFAMDDNKNMNPEGSAAGKIIIDTEKPEVKSEVSNTIFSPDDDGSKDTLKIKIEILKNNVESIEIPLEETISGEPLSMMKIKLPVIVVPNVDLPADKTLISLGDESKSEEQVWNVDIIDLRDSVVKTYTFTEPGTFELEWDARDEQGNKVADGVYQVKIYSTDKAGNYWEEIINNIIIDTQPKPIEATIVTSIFSPNGDSVKETVGFSFTVPITNGVESWQFEILTVAGKVVKTFSGEGIPGKEFSWNGIDENGTVADEGTYTGRLSVFYTNGNRSEGVTPPFIVDVTAPTAKVRVANELFSPNGDGNKDQLIIEQTTSEEDEEWIGTVFDGTGRKIKSWIWQGSPPRKFFWDGKDDNNSLSPDGSYSYKLTCTDTAGNSFTSDPFLVKIFTEETPVFVTASLESFSPNQDRIKDLQQFQVTAKISGTDSVTSWTLIIKDENDLTIQTEAGTGNLPDQIEWNGENASGGKAPDGLYQAVLDVDFESGNRSKSRTRMFEIDTVPPEVTIELVSSVFSPDNDTYLDNLEILQKGSNEDQWQAVITPGKSDTILFKKFYDGRPLQKEIWSGKDLDGNLQKNGFYRYTITSTDKAGNSGSAETTFVLKNVFTNAFLTIESDRFSPNDDKVKDTLGLVPYMNTIEDLLVYKVEIVNTEGNVVKLIQGEKSIPEMITWDGYDNAGKIAPDGVYTAVLTGLFIFGNRPTGTSAPFILDTTPPDLTVSSSPEFFSPDNDGVDDEMTIRISAEDKTGINNWKLDILYPDKKRIFQSYSGEGTPTDRILWNGSSISGDMVESAEDYPVRMTAEDEVGNKQTSELDPLQVDILVIKLDDGRLKIKVSNISFKPNRAIMEETAKNKKILDLLGKALRKYRQYTVSIEGHANRFKKGLDANRAKLLSEERAKTVAKELAKRGIRQSQMTTVGKGFDEPIQPLKDSMTSDERANLAKNRRVEFYLDKK
jgi:flagellar hook assembly protein FlgD/outer membrane protein OmpA-like peptidoglycan-associated protein